MRRSRLRALSAVVALLVGVALAYFVPFSRDDSFTIGYVGSSGIGGLPWLLLMTTERVVGVVLAWLATLALAGLLGHRLARPR